MANYRLSDGYCLRGWRRLPYAAVDAQTGEVSFFDRAQWRALKLCDGAHDLNSPLVPDSVRNQVAEFEQDGLVVPCEPGEGPSADQAYRFFDNRYLGTVHWILTGRCNFRCKHCYMSAPDARYGELSHASVMDIVRQISECGISSVSLSGGEPLVRPDFLEIVDALLDAGVNIRQIYSNGALVSDELLDTLEARGCKPCFVMSYDGAGWHDWVRGVPGAEEMVLDAFRRCSDRGLPTHAQVGLFRGNDAALRNTMLRLRDAGCGSCRVGRMTDDGEWKRNGAGLTLTSEEFYEACLSYLPRYYEDGMPVAVMFSSLVALDPSRPNWYSVVQYKPADERENALALQCAREHVEVFADGRINICQQLDADFVGTLPIVSDDPAAKVAPLCGQLQDGTPLMRYMDMRLHEVVEANGECAACPFLSRCHGGCRAEALLKAGDFCAPSPSACEFYKGGLARRIVETMRGLVPDGDSAMLHDDFVMEALGLAQPAE